MEFSLVKFAELLGKGLGDYATTSRVELMIKYGILKPTRCPRTHNPTLRPDDLLTAFCALRLKKNANITLWGDVGRLMGNSALSMVESPDIRSTTEWNDIVNELIREGLKIKDYPRIAPISSDENK